MRFGLLILTVFIDTLAQTGLEYQYDENGHILFTEVVKTELSNELLLANAAAMMSLKKAEQSNTGTGKFKKTTSFKLYKKRLGKSPHGELSYTIRLEVRDSRYRYVINDFMFHPLEKNRYGRFVRAKDEAVELKKHLLKPDKTWNGHKQTILEKINKVIENIKHQMSVDLQENQGAETVKIDDEW